MKFDIRLQSLRPSSQAVVKAETDNTADSDCPEATHPDYFGET